MRRVLVAALAAAAVGLTGGRAAANLIVNGGFEEPATGSFTTIPAGDPSLTGWTVVDGSVDVVNTAFYPAFEGDQSLDLDGSSAGTIEQSFATAAGTTYTLTFAYANNPGGTVPASANVSVVGTATLLSQDFTHGSSTDTDMDYVIFSGSFTADSATTTLRFTSLNPAGSIGGIALDAVSVTAGTPAAVPEPASLALLGAGAVGLAGYRLRRRAPAAA
jgi:choice-of-anchor C domain-containing protein